MDAHLPQGPNPLNPGLRLPSDKLTMRPDTPVRANRITGYRRIENWENFFLCSALCSVAVSLGLDEKTYSKEFFSALTGDMFAYLYSRTAPGDSGLSNYFYMPQAVKACYAAMGRDCLYVAGADIPANREAVHDAIRASVDKGIPVLAWGMGNVTLLDGSIWNPLPEGCLIGGYDGDTLLVNLYPGPERIAVDADGYTAITGGLDATKGLFFAGEPAPPTPMQEVYNNALQVMETVLSLEPLQSADGHTYLFGEQAFDEWARVITDDALFAGKDDGELAGACWDLHASPYCMVCTTDVHNYTAAMARDFPALAHARELAPLFQRMHAFKEEIWAFQGGFFPPMDQFRKPEYRAHIAGILTQMGALCGEILALYA